MDIFKRATSGDPMSGMPAEVYNLLLDLLKDHRHRFATSEFSTADVKQKLDLELQVRNDTEGALAQFSIVGLNERIVGPGEDASFHFGELVYSSKAPKERRACAILQRPAEAGGVVKALASGLTLARVNFITSDHHYAKVVDGDYLRLESTGDSSAPASIYKRLDGDWCLVILCCQTDVIEPIHGSGELENPAATCSGRGRFYFVPGGVWFNKAVICSGSGTSTPPEVTGVGAWVNPKVVCSGIGRSLPEPPYGRWKNPAVICSGSGRFVPPNTGDGAWNNKAVVALGFGHVIGPTRHGAGAWVNPAVRCVGSGKFTAPVSRTAGASIHFLITDWPNIVNGLWCYPAIQQDVNRGDDNLEDAADPILTGEDQDAYLFEENDGYITNPIYVQARFDCIDDAGKLVYRFERCCTVAGPTLRPGFGNIQLGGSAPGTRIDYTEAPTGAGNLQLNGFAPSVSESVSPPLGSITISGYAPTTDSNITVSPSAGNIQLDGFVPEFAPPFVMSPTKGDIQLNGFAPTIDTGSNQTVSPTAVGNLQLDGFAPTMDDGSVTPSDTCDDDAAPIAPDTEYTFTIPLLGDHYFVVDVVPDTTVSVTYSNEGGFGYLYLFVIRDDCSGDVIQTDTFDGCYDIAVPSGVIKLILRFNDHGFGGPYDYTFEFKTTACGGDAPTVDFSDDPISINGTTLTITGTNFDTTSSNNTVALLDNASMSVSCTVDAATSTTLTCTIANPSTTGSLTAVVTTTGGGSSGSPVEVADVVAGVSSVFTSDGSWTATFTGKLSVTAIGGGGGGSNALNAARSGAGGGGGEYAIAQVDVIAGVNYPYTVGGGGSGAGGDSTWDGGSQVYAHGGSAASGATAGTPGTGGTGTTVHDGGVGGAATTGANKGGGGGGAPGDGAGSGGVGSAGSGATGGAGGSSSTGTGGVGGVGGASPTPGGDGFAYGGGGGGGGSKSAGSPGGSGGAGSYGAIIIAG